MNNRIFSGIRVRRNQPFRRQPQSEPQPQPVEPKVETKKEPKQYFLRLSLKDQIIFIKRLAILVRAGTPLLTSLHMLQKQAKRSLKIILDSVIRDVENGMYLATSLAKYRKVFGEFAVNIIEIGEISGTLSENLEYLASELKKTQTLRRKVIGAMVYPIFIIFATFGITALLTVFVFPKILPIFKSVNFDLPWTTKTLIFVSNLLLHNGFFIFLGLVVLFILLLVLHRKSERFHLLYDRMILKAPVLGDLLVSYNVANICRTLGILLKSNVAIVRSTHITAYTTRNLVYKRELEQLAGEVLKGSPISTHLEVSPEYFPPIMSQMITVAESTGNLSETLLYLADMYEEEVDDLTKNLSTVLEPLLLIFMGLLVGFVAISIITPIYGITQHLNPR